jgi:ribose-phosphate pyrophosphokinase
MAIVEKRRMGNTMQSEALTLIGDVNGLDAIVVDEEVLTGGSIANAVQVVRDHGARDVTVCCTHPVFTDKAIERLRELNVKEVVTTNTLPIPPRRRLPNMTILSIAPLIGDVIQRVHEGRSVGEIFNE